MTKIYAHRGYKLKYPENTMIAFKKAYEHGADGIELDIHLSKDNQIIVIHDDTLDRTTLKSGYVNQMDYQEIKKAKMKQRGFKYHCVPLLSEVLDFIQQTDMLLNIEIKGITDGELEQQLLELLEPYQMNDRIVISSFNLDSIKRIKMLGSTIETAFLYSQYVDQPWLLRTEYLFDAIHADTFYTSRSFSEIIQSHGLPTRIYTVNKIEDIHYWLDSKIDAIITDDVETAVQIKNSSKKTT